MHVHLVHGSAPRHHGHTRTDGNSFAVGHPYKKKKKHKTHNLLRNISKLRTITIHIHNSPKDKRRTDKGRTDEGKTDKGRPDSRKAL